MFYSDRAQVQCLKRKESSGNVNVPYIKKVKILSDSSKKGTESVKSSTLKPTSIEDDFKEADDQYFSKLDETEIELYKSDESNIIIPSFNLFSDNCTDLYSVFKSKIEYHVECFQLDLEKNFLHDDNLYDRKLISENHYPCLEKTEHYYYFVEPIKTPEYKDIIYDPLLDGSVPNLNAFTDIELSFLREVSCGCEYLTWDQYQKLNLIDPDKDSQSLGNINHNSFVHKNSVKKSKYVIEDASFFYHHHHHHVNNVLYFPEEVNVSAQDNHSPLNVELLNEQVEDPLYYTSESKKVSTVEEFLPVASSEFEFLKKRMEEFKLKKTDHESFSTFSTTQSRKLSHRKSVDDDLIIHDPSKENASCSKNTDDRMVDIIVDNFDEIEKIINLPKSMSSKEKEEKCDLIKDLARSEIIEPSTSNSRKRKQNMLHSSFSDKEVFSEPISKLLQGIILSNNEFQILKDADLNEMIRIEQ